MDKQTIVNSEIYQENRKLLILGQLGNVSARATRKVDPEVAKVNAQLLMDCMSEGILIEPELVFKAGVDVYYRDPETKGTLLHYAAAYGVRSVIKLLLKEGKKLPYLSKDAKGRYASELAYEIPGDIALGRLLIKKESEGAIDNQMIIYGPDAGTRHIDLTGD